MFNEDGSLVLVFNGEIFNYRELRARLLKTGHLFSSDADAEVLLHLYEELGSELCNELEGMFAFAIWDRKRCKLFASRDPFGEKPFYYVLSPNNTGLAFASAATALARVGFATGQPDPEAIARYLLFGAGIGTQTLIKGVRALPPGGKLEYTPTERVFSVSRYRSIETLADSVQEPARPAPEFTWDLIRAAVQRRMIADVPVGVFISGGIDSTTIAAAMREIAPDRILSFAIGYESPHQAFDETAHATSVAKWVGTQHHTEVITADAFAGSLDALMEATDLPSHDGVNTFFASRLAARHVKVVMSGLGMDELLGGYSTFRYEYATRSPLIKFAGRIGSAYPPLWTRLIRRAEDAGSTTWPLLLLEQCGFRLDDPFYRWYQVRRFTPPQSVLRLMAPAPTHLGKLMRGKWEDQASYFCCQLGVPRRLTDSLPVVESAGYMSPVLLRDSDAMSMYHGVELRVPFLDTGLVKQGLLFPLDQLMSRRRGKEPLRSAVTGHVPGEVLTRRKQGFGVPMGWWLWHPHVRGVVTDALLAPPRLAQGILDPTELRALHSSFYGAPRARSRHRLVSRIWMAYTLLRWLDRLDQPS